MGETGAARWRYHGRPDGALPTITVLTGEAGPARALTDQVTRWLDERHIDYRRVPGQQLAPRSMPLPTVIAWFEGDNRDVAYRGYGRIVSDFLPRFREQQPA